MKPLLLTTMLAFAAPAAEAGDVSFSFGFGRHGKHFQVRVDDRKPHARSHVHKPKVHRHRAPRAHTRRVWVPVRYETVREKVWVPGYHRRVWVPAVYHTHVDRCGHTYRHLVKRGYHTKTFVRGHFEFRSKRVKHGGHYETVSVKRPRHRQKHHRS
ncbi:MAG: hypothetical protein ACYTGN_11930 [Planctomycetota bacterium]|jgi:hypothetical protein